MITDVTICFGDYLSKVPVLSHLSDIYFRLTKYKTEIILTSLDNFREKFKGEEF